MSRKNELEGHEALAAEYDDSHDASMEDDALPLLEKGEETPRKRSGLPLQAVLVLLCRVPEPMCLQVIFPFVNNLVEEQGIASDAKQIGLYAGILESLFPLAQALVVLPMSRSSDAYGRRTVILFGVFGAGISVVAFSLSTSWTALVITRMLNGATNGITGVVRVILRESTDDPTRAFGLFPVTFTGGSALGALLGGYLSHPAERHETLFGWSSTLRAYPYLLPCSAAALVCFGIFASTLLYVKETLKPARAEADNEEESRLGFRDAFTPRVRATTANFCSEVLVMISTMALIPVYGYTKVADGGVGLSPSEIGLVLGAQGISGAVLQLLLFPHLVKAVGLVRLIRFTTPVIIVFATLLPLVYYLARIASSSVVTAVLSALMTVFSFGHMSMACGNVLIIDAAPHPRLRGTVSGFAETIAALMRALGPSLFSALFSLSIASGWPLVWVAFIALTCGNFALSFLLDAT